MKGRIERHQTSKIEHREDACLETAWIDSGSNVDVPAELTWLTQSDLEPIDDQKRPALVLVGRDSTPAEAWLLAHAAAGRRIYILMGSSGLSDEVANAIATSPDVMLRRVEEVPVTGVIAGLKAQICIGVGFVLELDGQQTESLRQVFVRLFWHHASREAWPESGELVWRDTGERPFDIPDLPLSAPVRLVAPSARQWDVTDEVLLHVSNGPLPGGTPRRVWFPGGPAHHSDLRRLVDRGVEVVWDDLGLPDIRVRDGEGELLMPGDEHRLSIKLTRSQAADVARLLGSRARWRFERDIRIGEQRLVGTQFWLPDAPEPRGLVDEQTLPVPDVQAQYLREVEGAKPCELPEPDPLSLKVRYEWVVVPPRVPAEAKEDPLVGQWRKLSQEWTSRLEKVRDVLTEAESERGRLSRAFSRLASAMLGFGQKQSGLLEEVESLMETRLADEAPPRVHELLDRLVELEGETHKIRDDLRAAEETARDEEEQEKQQAAWKSRVGNAEEELAARRAEFAAAEPEPGTLEREEASVKESLKTADKRAKKDLLARRKRISDDLTRARKTVKRLADEIAALQKQAAEPFEFRSQKKLVAPAKQSGARFVPQVSSRAPTPHVPSEALPRVGVLRVANKERYLVIENWEDLDQGEQEASRLSASLVAGANV